MHHITHRIGIKAPAAQIYQALATLDGLASWWTEDVRGSTQPGGSLEFCFHTPSGELLGRMVMQVQKAQPPVALQWLCTEGPQEWLGTNIGFELTEQDQQTTVVFGHRNWREPSETSAHCSMKWATFLLSLKALLETGVGRPAPNDLKIDNWN